MANDTPIRLLPPAARKRLQTEAKNWGRFTAILDPAPEHL